MNSIKAHGVLVHTPDSTDEVPAPGTIDMVVVTNKSMDRCVARGSVYIAALVLIHTGQ